MDRIYPIIWLLCAYACWGSPVIPGAPSLPGLHGDLQSPLFPQPYLASLSEQWYLSVPEGYRIQLTFTHLDVEPSPDCYYDSVTVMYKQNTLGKFCGQEKSADGHYPGNQPILSPGNHLYVVFQTDDSNAGPHQHTGFSAFYQAIDVDECSLPEPDDGSGPLCSQICHNTLGSYLCSCHHGYELRPDQRTCDLHCGGGLYTEPEGVLSSPGYPLPSPHGLSCQYHISVEPGFILTLNFTGLFHIEHNEQGNPDCPYHWLQVSIPGRAPVKLCGKKSPGVIHTHFHSVELEYHTDTQGLSYGWNIQYNTQRVQCESPMNFSHGEITPSLPQYFYRDYIHMRCYTGYRLMMGDKEINSVNYTCKANRKWKDHQNNDIIPKCFPVCGRPTVPLMSSQIVLGGADAPAGTFPWQIFLNTKERGGAAVIGDKWILTAAHNLVTDKTNNLIPVEELKVYVGDIDVKNLLKNSPLSIASLHPHPQYDSNNYKHDIALIKLQQPLTFNHFVMPLCVPADGFNYTTGSTGLVSGFGRTETGISNKLKYLQLPLVDRKVCSRSIDDQKSKSVLKGQTPTLTDNMFCAGFPEGSQDTSNGDSGGAFVLRENGQYWAAGILSWEIRGSYGVYTRVAEYLDWIKKTKEEN